MEGLSEMILCRFYTVLVCLHTFLKSGLLVWAMEVYYKESMLLVNRGNGDLCIRGPCLLGFYLFTLSVKETFNF